ncbi:hypothetical protein FLBR109950_06750 [Flavobacterium branchiophilum]|uniref:Uncharacterized protein n=1 Tax=Flavobacterium branchiophilum (strain FL-15) TaxID=1034807 RepID=G2Z147_FLABF|nr:hypothetical protein [Flavobacterium branchiophilum]CCB69610.1 Hypothetical protein FBFL15_1545 [Flavobacterium branchiophilum FL-15]
MSLMRRLFPSKKIVCPRCLGKKQLDWDIIRKLDMELRWEPGKCAYCNGNGEVSIDIIRKLPVKTPYLTTSLSRNERNKLINGDIELIQKLQMNDYFIELTIKQIVYLHFEVHLNIDQIAGFLVLSNDKIKNNIENVHHYINRVIEKNKYNYQ